MSPNANEQRNINGRCMLSSIIGSRTCSRRSALSSHKRRKPAAHWTDFVSALDDRIKSLARTHELLSHNRWHGVSLEEIVRRELAPYTAANTEIGGPRVTLRAEAAQAVAMVLQSWPPIPQNTVRFPNKTGGCCCNGDGYGMDRMAGWRSNGRSSAAPQFGTKPLWLWDKHCPRTYSFRAGRLGRPSFSSRWIALPDGVPCRLGSQGGASQRRSQKLGSTRDRRPRIEISSR